MPIPSPLLLLPGLLCDARLWHAQIDGLGDIAQVQVADLTRDDSVAAMATRVLAQAPPRFALAGLSMGGYVAFEILRQQADRVERLALLDTSAAPDSPERARQRRIGIQAIGLGKFAGVTRQLLPRLVHARHVDGDVGEAVQAMARRIGPDAYLRQQKAILGRPDSRPLLADIRVPTLIVVGEDDVMTPPAEADAMHAGIASSSLHRIKHCGHLPSMEAPEQTTALMRQWLLD